MGGLSGFSQGLTGVIGPALPKRNTLIALVIGVLLGLVWAYLVSPTIYYDADPSTLQQNFQDEWVKLLAHRQAATNADLTEHIASLLTYVDDPLGIVDRLLADPAEAENRQALQNIRRAAEMAQPNAATAPQPNVVGDVMPFIVAPLIILIMFLILSVLWNLLIYPFLEPTINRVGIGRRSSRVSGVSNEQSAREIQAIREAKKALAENRTDYSDTLGTPLMQKMSVYALGRGQYDDSFSIEDENKKFLGECGAGISETIGVGDPKKVTAIEVWLFDKDDYVRTVTKVFASAHAFNDAGLRTKLEPKGDLVLAEPGAVAVLETSSLRLQARIVDMEYGAGPLPPNSYFEKMTIELAVWRKVPGAEPQRVEVGAAPAASVGEYMPPAPAVPASPATTTYSPPPASAPAPRPYTPPPATTPYTPPASRPAPSPYSPPPAASPDPDDDPFGGTGDFNPVR
ncbi:MAG: hypothetical protein DIU68_016990 [Chloroflexota bacterium]